MNRGTPTTPIINIIQDDKSKTDQYLADILLLMRNRQPYSSKDFHKNKLGKQNYCLNGTVRHWVWQTDMWRVYVSKRGMVLEVLELSNINEAWEAWQDYLQKMK